MRKSWATTALLWLAAAVAFQWTLQQLPLIEWPEREPPEPPKAERWYAPPPRPERPRTGMGGGFNTMHGPPIGSGYGYGYGYSGGAAGGYGVGAPSGYGGGPGGSGNTGGY